MYQTVLSATRTGIIRLLVITGLSLMGIATVYPAPGTGAVENRSDVFRADPPTFDTVTSHSADIIQLLAGDFDGDNNADIESWDVEQ